MGKHPHDEPAIDPRWKWELTKTGDNEWHGKWNWTGEGDPPIPPDRPPH